MQEFRDGIGQPARANIVNRADRIHLTQRHAGVDDLLTAPLHFRVVALYRGKVEPGITLPGIHGTGRTTTETNQHRRPAEHDHLIARLQALFFDLRAINGTEATCEHDRFVIAPTLAAFIVQFKTAEIPGQIGPPEFIIECRRAQRAIAHDIQGRRHARVQRACGFPWLRQIR